MKDRVWDEEYDVIVVGVGAVVEAVVEEQYAAGRHGHGQGAVVERLAGEFAIGVALWAVKGALVAAGHDADTTVFDGRFLQIN